MIVERPKLHVAQANILVWKLAVMSSLNHAGQIVIYQLTGRGIGSINAESDDADDAVGVVQGRHCLPDGSLVESSQ